MEDVVKVRLISFFLLDYLRDSGPSVVNVVASLEVESNLVSYADFDPSSPLTTVSVMCFSYGGH